MRIPMRSNRRFVLLGAAFFAVIVPAVSQYAAAEGPLGTVFTYQGELTSGGVPVDEPLDGCDFEFTLWDADVDGSQVGPTLMPTALVADGRFTVALDFGPDIFTGEARFMEIAVCCPSGCEEFTTLSPRQELTPAPHALALPGLYTQQNATSPNVIGGYSGNSVEPGAVGATIAGGGLNGGENRVFDNHGTVGGGGNNQAGTDDGPPSFSEFATVGGGDSNTASGRRSTVGGGRSNTASGTKSTVGGGGNNDALGQWSTVGGGEGNTASQIYATVGGGVNNEASDHEIVLRARDGDHEAFRILVKRHETRVHALALRLLRDPDWAQDAVQEAFIKAYRALRKFEGRSAFGTWMYRLTYNHCLDMRRADKSGRYVEWEEERAMGASDSPALASSIRGPEEEIERGELREQLQKAIETLPEPIRQTLVMREIDGLRYGEIADLLEIPKGTVMSRLFHARKRLREVLSEQGVSPFEIDDSQSPEETA